MGATAKQLGAFGFVQLSHSFSSCNLRLNLGASYMVAASASFRAASFAFGLDIRAIFVLPGRKL